MRAVIEKFDDVSKGDLFPISDINFHHLARVARGRVGEKVLMMNGKGCVVKTEMIEVSKKSIIIKALEDSKVVEPSHNISLLLSSPKKDAFEEIVSKSVELGVRKIYLVKGKYSFSPLCKKERLNKIIESAMVQSNNPYYLKIYDEVDINDFLANEKKSIFHFSTQNSSKIFKITKTDKEIFALIGPEAGFSDEEERLLSTLENVHSINLPIPIMRSPTATCTALGYLLASIL